MDYQSASAKLTGRCKERRKIENNTYLERRECCDDHRNIAVRLHQTDILTFRPDGSVTYDSGGWRTVTTKARMNEFGPITITQQNGQWFVSVRNPEYVNWDKTPGVPYYKDLGLYEDGMIVKADGTIEGMEPIEAYQERLKLRKRVQRYAAAYMRAMEAGKVPAPSNGDCFYCLMREVETHKPLGECTRNLDHLMSHLEERYFVPSLLARAVEVMPHSPMMLWAIGEKWAGEPKPEHTLWSDYTRRNLQKCLSRYMLRQLGQAA